MSALRTGSRPALAHSTPPLRVTIAEDPQVAAVFSGRERNLSLIVGGGDVEAARRDLLGVVGLGLDDAVFMGQVHAAGVARVGLADRGRGARDHSDALAGVDALVTFDADVALVVLVADCVPVLLADPERGVAAVHAGRRGVEAGVVPTAVASLAGDDPGRVVALLGPAIGACCYEVPSTLAQRVAALVPEAAARTTWGAPALDLPAAVAAQLRGAGVDRIERVGSCTRCRPKRWHSHRADPGSGRQAGVVARLGRTAPDRPAQVAAKLQPWFTRPSLD